MKKWCNLRFTNSLLCGALLVDSTSANCFNSVGAEFLLKVKPIFETIGDLQDQPKMSAILLMKYTGARKVVINSNF